ARKKALLPTTLRETSQWLYVENIEEVAPEPVACITVSSEDRTYLVGRGMVPTSNTQLLAYSAFQYALEGRPVIVIDPKKGSDLSPAFGGGLHHLLPGLVRRLLRWARWVRRHRGVRSAALLEDAGRRDQHCRVGASRCERVAAGSGRTSSPICRRR